MNTHIDGKYHFILISILMTKREEEFIRYRPKFRIIYKEVKIRIAFHLHR